MFLVRMFLISYILTVVVEEVLALIWGYRSAKDLLTVLWVNTITNPAVVGLRYLFNQVVHTTQGQTAVIIVLELAVLFAEWRLFRKFLSKGRYFFLFALLVNGASYGAGLLIPVILRFLSGAR